jgi:hypothetical protein
MITLKGYSSGVILGVCYGMDFEESSKQLCSVLKNNESMGKEVCSGMG